MKVVQKAVAVTSLLPEKLLLHAGTTGGNRIYKQLQPTLPLVTPSLILGLVRK